MSSLADICPKVVEDLQHAYSSKSVHELEFHKTDVRLFIDGRALPNPGVTGAWAAFSLVTVLSTTNTDVDSSDKGEFGEAEYAKIGMVTNQQAEYLSLIGGLQLRTRQLEANKISSRSTKVTVYLHSEVVMNQMNGSYRVKNAMLRAYKAIAYAYASKFAHVDYICYNDNIDDNENNHENDINAEHISSLLSHVSKLSPKQMNSKSNISIMSHKTNWTIYRPCLVNMVHVAVMGKRVLASHDIMSVGSGNSHFIDLRFIQSLDPHAYTLLHNIHPVHPTSLLVGSVDMSVIGSVRVHVSVFWPKLKDQSDTPISHWADALVIDSLPVPFHLSTKGKESLSFGPTSFVLSSQEETKFKKENVPEINQTHPYWESQNISFFPPVEYLQTL